MEVKEKRKALVDHCYYQSADCRKCVLYNPHAEECMIRGDDFDEVPEEMIHKWHAMVFPEPVIKDSGERRQFYGANGKPVAVRDMASGKGRMDLLPWAAIMEVAKHCENGAIKYGEHNVDKGLPTSSFCDSAARHLAKYLDGWTDEPHLLAATWNLLWAVQMTVKKPEMVDTPWRGDNDV